MAIEYDQLRRIVLDHLREQPEGEIGFNGDGFARSKAKQLGLAYSENDGVRVFEILHELYREGIIVSGNGNSGSSARMTWPFYRVTEYGWQALDERDYVPHDPDGYLKQIKEDIPSIDPTIIRYLEEALGCLTFTVRVGWPSRRPSVNCLDAILS